MKLEKETALYNENAIKDDIDSLDNKIGNTPEYFWFDGQPGDFKGAHITQYPESEFRTRWENDQDVAGHITIKSDSVNINSNKQTLGKFQAGGFKFYDSNNRMLLSSSITTGPIIQQYQGYIEATITVTSDDYIYEKEISTNITPTEVDRVGFASGYIFTPDFSFGDSEDHQFYFNGSQDSWSRFCQESGENASIWIRSTIKNNKIYIQINFRNCYSRNYRTFNFKAGNWWDDYFEEYSYDYFSSYSISPYSSTICGYGSSLGFESTPILGCVSRYGGGLDFYVGPDGITRAKQLYLNDHTSPIGTVQSSTNTTTKSYTSSVTSGWKDLTDCQILCTPGCYVVTAHARFENTVSGKVYGLAVGYTTPEDTNMYYSSRDSFKSDAGVFQLTTLYIASFSDSDIIFRPRIYVESACNVTRRTIRAVRLV